MLKVNKNKTGCIERQILGLFYLLFWQTAIQVYFKYAQSLSPFHVPGFFFVIYFRLTIVLSGFVFLCFERKFIFPSAVLRRLKLTESTMQTLGNFRSANSGSVTF